MFRYESRAFTQTADVLQNACGELDQYEDVIRSISRAWSRNPGRIPPTTLTFPIQYCGREKPCTTPFVGNSALCNAPTQMTKEKSS